ncbi:hypothetical protein [Actinokineospora sp. NBRC 105648]|uniref:hypothetical protein n=1 Tax=Actinokineospora sp. NBRC 105648 TaxID=3032206 RepID=UPI0024A1A43D|nr:hypothetical protein [Actinokineospora sp. NBRC 105648]GLZ38432.1 hypothetical protein Acsp05_20560 [Actinokineospora sp. NBRC 105648]
MDKRVDEVVEVDLTGRAESAEVHLFGGGHLDPRAYIASLRVDMGAYRDFLRRVGAGRWKASGVSVRLLRRVGTGAVQNHTVIEGTLWVYLGAALVKVFDARRDDPALTEQAAAELLARHLTDAMVHLGGHVADADLADAELGKPQEVWAKVYGIVGLAIPLTLFVPMAVEGPSNPFTYLYGFASAWICYWTGSYLGSSGKRRRQEESGEATAVRERRPDRISADFADEPPFVTVELTPFDTWPS